jgi:putative ATP-dependent endonuclease of OLD family
MTCPFRLADTDRASRVSPYFFLFQAYIEVLLKPTFHTETEAILALEEPEAHLHPQAARALTSLLGAIAAQKIISTHSPYVLQGVPTTDIRLFRRNGASVSVQYVRRAFAVPLPAIDGIAEFCKNSKEKFVYDETFGVLRVGGSVTEKECRELMRFTRRKRACTHRFARFNSEAPSS